MEDNSNAIQRHESGGPIQSTEQGFGTQSITRANETASTAVAEQARASIEARYVVAMKRPRNLDNVRVKILAECQRPGFAHVARYSKPMGGKKIEGPSIRFAEAALRAMGNVHVETMVVWDDDDKRIFRVSVTDIESNLPYSSDVVVQKTVERSQLKDGQRALSSRVNSQNKVTYLVQATDDDILNKQNALISKALRTQALRLLPGDILEEAMDAVLDTQSREDARDPDAAKKKLIDAFARIGVLPDQLAEYLGHDTSQVVPAELLDLRAVYSAIQEGETTWRAVLDMRSGSNEKPTEEAQKAQAAVNGVKDRLKAKADAKNSRGEQQTIDTRGEAVK